MVPKDGQVIGAVVLMSWQPKQKYCIIGMLPICLENKFHNLAMVKAHAAELCSITQ